MADGRQQISGAIPEQDLMEVDRELYESIGNIYKGPLLAFALDDCVAHHRSETLCSSFLLFY